MSRIQEECVFLGRRHSGKPLPRHADDFPPLIQALQIAEFKFAIIRINPVRFAMLSSVVVSFSLEFVEARNGNQRASGIETE